MHRTLLLVVVFLIPLVVAGQPIATISTSAPLVINGVSVPVAGIPTWPLAAGDEIVTGSSPASITFHDGSVVTVSKDSKAKVGKSSVDLLTGTAAYKLGSAKGLDLRASGRPIDVKAQPEGVVSVEGHGNVVVRGKGAQDQNAMGKYKKPKPRSGHEKDDDDDDDVKPPKDIKGPNKAR